MEREEFLDTLETRRKSTKPVDIKDVRLAPPPDHTGHRRLVFNDEIIADGDNFDKLAGSLFGVPASFLKRAPIDLGDSIVKRMFKENKVQENKQLVLRDHKITTSKPRETPFQPAGPVFQKILKELDGVKQVNFRDNETYFTADLVSEKLELKPKVGDITQGGLRCLYSEIMDKKPSIAPYTERLVCTNGMTFPSYSMSFDFEDLDSFLKSVVETVSKAKKLLSEDIDQQLKRSTEMKLNGEQAIRRVFQQHRIPTALLDRALAAHVIEGDGTAYGMLQAITRAANHESVNQRNRDRLQSLGGVELNVVSATHCQHCYAAL